jgi:hypothetical protein
MWAIPAARMKRKDQGEHLVPLSCQAVSILRELHHLTGRNRLVFPSVRSPQAPMSENTITAALRSLGYTGDQMTGHGFRSTASTLLHERGYAPALIERQLAHGIRNKVAAAYNRAEYLPERTKMMQEWADYLDALRAGLQKLPGAPGAPGAASNGAGFRAPGCLKSPGAPGAETTKPGGAGLHGLSPAATVNGTGLALRKHTCPAEPTASSHRMHALRQPC